MRRLGIDPGDRRVGLALSEEDSSFAHPHATLTLAKAGDAVKAITQAAREAGVQQLVLGLPLLMNGDEGPRAKKARALATALENTLNLPVVLWDERLTTVAAERQLSEAGRSAKAQRKVVDQAAATVLLQSYLDAQYGSAAEPPALPPPAGGRGRRGKKGRR